MTSTRIERLNEETARNELLGYHVNWSETGMLGPPKYRCLHHSESPGWPEHPYRIGDYLTKFMPSVGLAVRQRVKEVLICLSWESDGDSAEDSARPEAQAKDCSGNWFYAYAWKRMNRETGAGEILGVDQNGLANSKKIDAKPSILPRERMYLLLSHYHLIQPYVLQARKNTEIFAVRQPFGLEHGKLESKATRIRGEVEEAIEDTKFFQFAMVGYRFDKPSDRPRLVGLLETAFILWAIQWNSHLRVAELQNQE